MIVVLELGAFNIPNGNPGDTTNVLTLNYVRCNAIVIPKLEALMF